MNLDYQVYKDAFQNAIDKKEDIHKMIQKIANKKLRNLYLIGCGGSLSTMYPALYLLEANSEFTGYAYNAGEFLQVKPKPFGSQSLTVLASSFGKTPETLEATRFAKEVGSPTIGIALKDNTPLEEEVDYPVSIHTEDGVIIAKTILTYLVILEFMRTVEKNTYAGEIIDVMVHLPNNLVEILKISEQLGQQFAEEYKNEQIFYTIGAGNCWGPAYSYAICILEEMQWITAQPIHAGEFFHGPLEIVDENSNLLIFKGEDQGRPLVDRVINFTKNITKRMVVIDTHEYPLPGIPEKMREYFSPLVISAVLENFSNSLAEQRNHPLSIRRYMHKMQY